jgi:hypothetical protein
MRKALIKTAQPGAEKPKVESRKSKAESRKPNVERRTPRYDAVPFTAELAGAAAILMACSR